MSKPTANYLWEKITKHIRWLILAFVWLVLVSFSLFWNLNNVQENIRLSALSEARSLFLKDLLYRKWAAMHGGVYVPVDAMTQPNPYLDVPDRDVITSSGKKLTLINPAYMIRQVHELSDNISIRSHITSLKPIRPTNAPDAWETGALRRFVAGEREYSTIESRSNQPYLRYMGALMVEKPCLVCHKKQLYKIGDVRGGISVTISLAKFERIAKEHSTSLIVWHFIIGLLGFLGILFMQWRLFRKEDEKIAAQFKAGLYRERSILLQSMGEGVYAMNLQGKCTVINPAALKMLGYTEDEVIGKSAHTLFHHHYCDNTVYPAELCNIHRVLDHRHWFSLTKLINYLNII